MNIAFELLTGGELLKKLYENGRVPEERAVEYVRQILSGVAYCHSKQIMHRDLKPENIVFESTAANSMVKIVDFGTCREFAIKDKASPAVGTKIYIAPEVSYGKYDEKCDVWSCGVIAYLLLTADLPNKWGNQTMEDKVLEKSMDLSHISSAARSFLLKSLALEPIRRASASDLLTHPWLLKSKTSFTCPETEALQRFTMFHVWSRQTESKLKQAALMYIATQVMSVQETESLRHLFVEMDEDRDGKLSPAEVGRMIDRAKLLFRVDISTIMSESDFDHSGFIDYTEFLTAATDWKRVLSNYHIEAVFKAFDRDHSSKIELGDIQRVFKACHVDPCDPVWGELQGTEQETWTAVGLQEFRVLVAITRE